MARASRKSIVVVSATGLAAAAIAAATATVGSAAPADPEDGEISYSSYVADNPDAGQQLRDGIDPATVPGVRDRTGATRESIKSDEAAEQALARENNKNGVTWERDSADLPTG